MGNGDRASTIPSKFLKEELDRLSRDKAEKDVVDTKFENVEKEVESATKRLSGWDKWLKGIVVAVVTGGVIIGGTIANLTFSNQALAEDVGGVKKDIVVLSSTVDEVQTSQNDLAETVKAAQELDEEKEAARIEELKTLLKNAVQEVRRNDRPRRRHRRAVSGEEGR